jgi:hypothetical protein
MLHWEEVSMKFRILFHFLMVASICVPIMAPAKVQAAALPDQAATGLLQFTSGGHVLGFAVGEMVVANGRYALKVSFAGANDVEPKADSSAVMKDSPTSLQQVVYNDLWEGITLAYDAVAGSIYRTTYTLAPGANPNSIRLRYNAPLTVSKNGALQIAFATGSMTESAPIAWQEIQGQRSYVDVSFRLQGREVGFALGKYNPGVTLIIDPRLTWNTFLGGSGSDMGRAIAIDGTGAIYVTGYSSAEWGEPERRHSGGYDVFVAKLRDDGLLDWNTFLGGGVEDKGFGIAVYDEGLFVTGNSYSAWGCDEDCTERGYFGGSDAFVASLDPYDGTLLWNTFLGAEHNDYGYGIAMDEANERLFVIGEGAESWGITPVRAWSGAQDAFVANLNPNKGTLNWYTFLGGIGFDAGLAITFSPENVFVAGSSTVGWGCTPSCTLRDYTNSPSDAFAANLNSATGGLIGNAFLGGSGSDYGTGITVDATSLYVSGYSNDTWGTPLRAYSDGYDAFAVNFNLDEATIAWSTFLGQDGTDYAFGIDVDEAGNVHVVGLSDATWGSPQLPYTLGRDVFVVVLNSSGTLNTNLFLGGGSDDYGYDIIAQWGQNWFMVAGGSDQSWGCPETDCTVRDYTASGDAFVAKVDLAYYLYLPAIIRK